MAPASSLFGGASAKLERDPKRQAREVSVIECELQQTCAICPCAQAQIASNASIPLYPERSRYTQKPHDQMLEQRAAGVSTLQTERAKTSQTPEASTHQATSLFQVEEMSPDVARNHAFKGPPQRIEQAATAAYKKAMHKPVLIDLDPCSPHSPKNPHEDLP